MLLKFLHKIGLTNLSDEEINLYYEKKKANPVVVSAIESLGLSVAKNAELEALSKINTKLEYLSLPRLISSPVVNVVSTLQTPKLNLEMQLLELEKAKAESDLFHLIIMGRESGEHTISQFAEKVFKVVTLGNQGELEFSEVELFIKHQKVVLTLELSSKDVKERIKAENLLSNFVDWAEKYEAIAHNKRIQLTPDGRN